MTNDSGGIPYPGGMIPVRDDGMPIWIRPDGQIIGEPLTWGTPTYSSAYSTSPKVSDDGT